VYNASTSDYFFTKIVNCFLQTTVSAIFVVCKQQYLMFLLFADNDNFNGSRTRGSQKKKKTQKGLSQK